MSTSYRTLQFDSLDDATDECQRLLDAGYTKYGNWSLGQICRHLRLTQDASMDGYPFYMSLFFPLRPLFRRFMMPRVLNGNSPKGLPTAGIFTPPNDLEDEAEVQAFNESSERYRTHTGKLYPHPGFGKLNHANFGRIHVAHAAHHLGFLSANNTGT